MVATRKQRERLEFDAQVRAVIDGGKDALLSMPDFGTIFRVVSGALTVEFSGQGRDTETGKGIRSARFQDFEYSNTVYVRGEDEFKTGWRAKLFFTLDRKVNPILVLKALERYGIRCFEGAHQVAGQDRHDLSHRFNVYILSDDYATMAVIRRLAGQDAAPGPADSRFPKSVSL